MNYKTVCQIKNKKVIQNIIEYKNYNEMNKEELKLFQIINCTNGKYKVPACKNKACYHCQRYEAYKTYKTIKNQIIENIFCQDNFFTLRLSYDNIPINSDFENLEKHINNFFTVINDTVKFINNKKKLLVISYQCHFKMNYIDNILFITPHVHFLMYSFVLDTPNLLHKIITTYKNKLHKSIKGLKNYTPNENNSNFSKVKNLRSIMLYIHNHIINYDEIPPNNTYTRAFLNKFAIKLNNILNYKHIRYVNKQIINDFVECYQKNNIEYNKSLQLSNQLFAIKNLYMQNNTINTDIWKNF